MAAPSAPFPGADFPNPFQNKQLLANPYPVYAMLRSANPVFKLPLPIEGPGVTVLSRHDDVEQVLKDPRATVDRVTLVKGIRSGASVSQLARALGVSRATARKLVAAEVAERVPSAGAKTAARTRAEVGG